MSKDVTYTAHVGANIDGELTLIVRRAIPAGVDGPVGVELPVEGMTLPQIEGELRRHGYALAEPWKTAATFAGLKLTAELYRL